MAIDVLDIQLAPCRCFDSPAVCAVLRHLSFRQRLLKFPFDDLSSRCSRTGACLPTRPAFGITRCRRSGLGISSTGT